MFLWLILVFGGLSLSVSATEPGVLVCVCVCVCAKDKSLQETKRVVCTCAKSFSDVKTDPAISADTQNRTAEKGKDFSVETKMVGPLHRMKSDAVKRVTTPTVSFGRVHSISIRNI